MSRFFRAAGRWFLVIVTVASACAFLFGALNPYFGFPYERWLWAVFGIGVLYIALCSITSLYFFIKDEPVSILGIAIDIHFFGELGEEARVTREYIIRSNMGDIAAFHFWLRPGWGGRIPRNDIVCEPVGDIAEEASYTHHVFGHENSGWDCVHELSPSIPYSMYLPVLPRWLTTKRENQQGASSLSIAPRKLFGTYMVSKLRDSAVYLDDFNNELLYYLEASHYPVKCAVVNLHFKSSKRPSSVLSWRVHRNAVRKVNTIQSIVNEYPIYCVPVDSLREEKLYIVWKFPECE